MSPPGAPVAIGVERGDRDEVIEAFGLSYRRWQELVRMARSHPPESGGNPP